MSEDQIRRGNTQASFNEEMSGAYLGQFAVIALVAGFLQADGNIPLIPRDWSYVMVGIIILVLCIVLSMIPIVSNIFLTLLTLMWGFIAFKMCIDEFDAGSGTSWTVAILVTLVAAGLNMSGMQWSKDID